MINNSVKLLGWLLILFLFLVLIVLPVLTSTLIGRGQLPLSLTNHLATLEQIQTITMQVFVVVWVFFVGSCFASFLNVVAWRVPRGRSILGSSHCPTCNLQLTFRDNLPIVGWLRNGGRCSGCSSPISPRYLIAEIVLGSLFLLLAIVELAGGGASLPLASLITPARFELMLFSPDRTLIQILLYHLVLISTLFTFALIETDGLKIPRSIFLLVAMLGIGGPLFWPDMQVVSWPMGVESMELAGASANTLLTSLIGGLLGCVLGFCLMRLLNVFQSVRSAIETAQSGQSVPSIGPSWFAGLIVAGIYLGWQSVIGISVIFLLLSGWLLLVSWLGRASNDPAVANFSLAQNAHGILLMAVLIQLLTWRLQAGWVPWMYGTQGV